MRNLLKTVSYAGLALTILPSLLVLNGSMDLERHYTWTLAGTVIWFLTAPFWMDRKKKTDG